MEIREAQNEVRTVFAGGAVGQGISGCIWLLSTVLGAWVDVRYGILMLAVGGALIFPLTQLAFRMLGRKASLGADNPFSQLAMQIAFIIPLCLPVIGAAALHNLNWFYPAFMIVVGAHYLPFTFLYGMWQYTVLAAALIAGGVATGLYFPDAFSLGGWITATSLLVYAVVTAVTTARSGPVAQSVN